MSSCGNLEIENFIPVSFRKKSRKTKNSPIQVNISVQNLLLDSDIDKETALRRIKAAEEEISTSDILSSTLASLRESLNLLDNPKVKKIICLGLGHIGERVISRYQLGSLLSLKNYFNIPVYVFDPIFYQVEKEVLLELNLNILNENLEGKYQASKDYATIFYFPHCPNQLTNNLLWSNWNLSLRNCIIICNSFHNIVENSSKKSLAENGFYISNIFNYTVELPIINTFKYYDIFNDTAIHVFPLNKLLMLPKDFWTNRIEPQYKSDSVEFISNTLDKDNKVT